MKISVALLILLACASLLAAQDVAQRKLSSAEEHFQKLVSERTAPPWFGLQQIEVQRIETLLSGNNLGADIKSDALVAAARIGDPELVQLLIRWGADVNHRAEDGQTVLMIAATQGFSVQCGNDPLVTSYPGHTEIVQAVLNARVRLDDQDDTGNTAFMLAASHGRSSSVQLLLKAGANANLRNKYGWTALFYAVNSNSNSDNLKEIVSALIANGAELNARDNDGKTALSYARGTNAIKEMLIRAGAIE